MKITEDSPIVGVMDQIAEVLIAGFLWLLCSIPVVTIGPASAALYYTIVKVVRKKRDTVTSAFFHSFKSNLKQGIGITVIYMLYALLLVIYFEVVKLSGSFNITPYVFVAAGIILAAPFF